MCRDELQSAIKSFRPTVERHRPNNSAQQFHRRNFEIRATKNNFSLKFSTVVLKSLWKSRPSCTKQPAKPIVYAFCTTTGQMRLFSVKHVEERCIQGHAKKLQAVLKTL